MKNFFKFILVCAIILLSASYVFADDWDSFGETSEEEVQKAVNVNGYAKSDLRFYPNFTSTVKFIPEGKISLTYDADKADFRFDIKLNENLIKNNPIDIIDDLSVRTYLGNLLLEAGKTRVVWGKTDGFHVVDNFNSDDFSDFIIPDYAERRISIPMIRAKYSFTDKNDIALEAVYTPFMAAERYDTDGPFTPADYCELKSQLALLATGYLGQGTAGLPATAATYPVVLSQANALTNNSSGVLYPNLNRLKYTQAGTRITGTFRTFDWGLSYYFGHFKTPSVNKSGIKNWANNYFYGKNTDSFIDYDKKQTIGLEAATTLWHFNLRAELAYNFTDDMAGTNQAVHNSSFQWIGGFDIDLPLWNMNLNMMNVGSFISNGDSCNNPLDVDYRESGSTDNKIVCVLSSSLLHDKLTPELRAVWAIESRDFVLIPMVGYNVTPAFNVNLSGMWIYCKNEKTQFKNFDNGNMMRLSGTYTF